MSRFVKLATLGELPVGAAKEVEFEGRVYGLFNVNGEILAIDAICPHQGGPLVDGSLEGTMVTCPWHGYQYLPETGASPPPFTEKVSTFHTQIVNGRVWIDPKPNPPGTPVEPARIPDAGVQA